MREPVNTKTYEQSFPMSGMETRDIMLMVESVLCDLRHKAAEDFAKRLRNYGHFNGDLTSNVYHSETHVRCEVVAKDYGLPLRLDDNADAALQEKREQLDAAGEAISRLQMELIESEQVSDELRTELRHLADGFDELAEVWGDEGVFKRLRQRLRELAGTDDSAGNGEIH